MMIPKGSFPRLTSVELELRQECKKRYSSRYLKVTKKYGIPICLFCGDKFSVQGHHENYSKPLDVLWLCRSHHADLHKIKRRCEIVDKNYVAGLRVLRSRSAIKRTMAQLQDDPKNFIGSFLNRRGDFLLEKMP